MGTSSLAGAFVISLLAATALTPGRAADMTNERTLNPQREPQNWILHHGNYQGHRYSLLKEINADTVEKLKPVFTVALSGFQNGGRYAHGNRRSRMACSWGRQCRTTRSTRNPARTRPRSGCPAELLCALRWSPPTRAAYPPCWPLQATASAQAELKH
jgi:hypothetical protein